MRDAFVDAVLGRCVYDPELAWYVARGRLGDADTDWSLSAETDADLAASLAAAHRYHADGARWLSAMRAALLSYLLPLKNGVWHDEDEPGRIYDAASIDDQIALESIIVYPDGTAEAFWTAGDLFFGHGARARLDLAGEGIEVSLAG